MINNSVTDCLISLSLSTKSDHVTPTLQQMFKVRGSKINITASWNDSDNVLNHR